MKTFTKTMFASHFFSQLFVFYLCSAAGWPFGSDEYGRAAFTTAGCVSSAVCIWAMSK